MILTENEQQKITQMCVNTMRFSSEFTQGGIFGSTGGGFAQQLSELRRSIASLDEMKKTSDAKALALALHRFEAALQASVTLSGAQEPGAIAGYINPSEIEGVLAAVDEIRKKHSLEVGDSDGTFFASDHTKDRHTTSPLAVNVAFAGIGLFVIMFIVFVIVPLIAESI